MAKSVQIFCPATVANVSVGYDVLGFCLDSIGDEMIISITEEPGIKISDISGFDLPVSAEENVAGLSAMAIYEAAGVDFGFDIQIRKNIKPGSGIGSSAASAVGAVYGINYLLDNRFSDSELIDFALEGECHASQSRHADNLAPCLMGGFILVRSLEPVDIISLPSPKNLYVTIIHPQIEIKTSDSRAALPAEITHRQSINQVADMGAFIHALHTSDYELISRSINDHIVEPYRKKLIPKFDEAKNSALDLGALAFGISGSGPSLFAFCEGREAAIRVEEELIKIYSNSEFEIKSYVSGISGNGITVISES